MRILCFDVGGTAIKYSLIEDENKIEVQEFTTRITENNNYILEDIIKKIEEYDNIDAVGVSTAGVVDNEKGRIIFSGPTIPGYTNTEIKAEIEKIYNIPCFVENDVNSAAIGEYYKGSYKGDTFCLTIGTGVGGAIIINDKIYHGFSNTAGEIGYMIIKDNHFQNIASTTYLVNSVSKKLNKKVNGKYIFENAKLGDEICNRAIDDLIENLSIGIVNIIYMFNPTNLIIGGGITAQGKYLEDKITKVVFEKLISKQFKTNISLAKVANAAGIYGIYYITKKGLKNEI